MLTGKIIGFFAAGVISGIIAAFILFDIFTGGNVIVPPVKVYALVLSLCIGGVAIRRLAEETSRQYGRHHHYHGKS